MVNMLSWKPWGFIVLLIAASFKLQTRLWCHTSTGSTILDRILEAFLSLISRQIRNILVTVWQRNPRHSFQLWLRSHGLSFLPSRRRKFNQMIRERLWLQAILQSVCHASDWLIYSQNLTERMSFWMIATATTEGWLFSLSTTLENPTVIRISRPSVLLFFVLSISTNLMRDRLPVLGFTVK